MFSAPQATTIVEVRIRRRKARSLKGGIGFSSKIGKMSKWWGEPQTHRRFEAHPIFIKWVDYSSQVASMTLSYASAQTTVFKHSVAHLVTVSTTQGWIHAVALSVTQAVTISVTQVVTRS